MPTRVFFNEISQETNTANQKDILLTRIQKIKSGLISSLCQTEHSNSG